MKQSENSVLKTIAYVIGVLTTSFFIWLGSNISELNKNMAVLNMQMESLITDGKAHDKDMNMNTSNIIKLKMKQTEIENKINELK